MEKRDELWPRGPCFYYDTALFPPGTDSFCPVSYTHLTLPTT